MTAAMSDPSPIRGHRIVSTDFQSERDILWLYDFWGLKDAPLPCPGLPVIIEIKRPTGVALGRISQSWRQSEHSLYKIDWANEND